MGTNFTAIFNALTQSPGDLIYIMVVGLSQILILAIAKTVLSKTENRSIVHHVMIGCGILLLLQSVILICSLLSPNDLTNTTMAFIITECLAGTLMIAWLTWTFLQGRDQFLSNGLIIFISCALILVGVSSILWIFFLHDAGTIGSFILLTLWQYGSLMLILAGLILILTTRPEQWIVAVVTLVVLASGYFLQLVFQDSNSYQLGAVRFAQMLSLPWMLFLIRRFGRINKYASTPKGPVNQSKKDKLIDTKPTLIDQLLEISLKETPEEKYKAVVRALSLGVVADLCYLVKVVDKEGRMQLLAGYDLIRERFLPQTTLTRDELPQISDALHEDRNLLLSQKDSEIQDATTLTSLLRYHSLGNLLAYPISFSEEHPPGGIILISPYTSKPWGQDTLILLDTIKATLSNVTFFQTPRERLRAEFVQSRNDKEWIQKEKKTLTQILIEKQWEINRQGSTIKQLKARFQIEKVATVKQIEQLQKEINELVTQAAEFERNVSKHQSLQSEINRLEKDKDQFQKKLMLANTRISELEAKSEQTGPLRLSMETKLISLDAITANIKLHTSPQMQQKNQYLEIINPDGRQMIKTDPDLLNNVLIGLMENAIEASGKGSKIHMSQKLSFETGMLILEITDFGEGLSQTEQRALFNADHVTFPGIGSIQSIRNAIRAIRLLQGKIWLKSKKKEFTTFRVQVPVRIID